MINVGGSSQLSNRWVFEFFESGLEVMLGCSHLDDIAAKFCDHPLDPSA